MWHELPNRILGHYFAEPGVTPVITLSPILENNGTLMRCVLAEEPGHHFTSAGDLVPRQFLHYRERLTIGRAEYRALRWAASFLMPGLEFRATGRYYQESWETAGEFQVTETLVRFERALVGQSAI